MRSKAHAERDRRPKSAVFHSRFRLAVAAQPNRFTPRGSSAPFRPRSSPADITVPCLRIHPPVFTATIALFPCLLAGGRRRLHRRISFAVILDADCVCLQHQMPHRSLCALSKLLTVMPPALSGAIRYHALPSRRRCFDKLTLLRQGYKLASVLTLLSLSRFAAAL